MHDQISAEDDACKRMQPAKQEVISSAERGKRVSEAVAVLKAEPRPFVLRAVNFIIGASGAGAKMRASQTASDNGPRFSGVNWSIRTARIDREFPDARAPKLREITANREPFAQIACDRTDVRAAAAVDFQFQEWVFEGEQIDRIDLNRARFQIDGLPIAHAIARAASANFDRADIVEVAAQSRRRMIATRRAEHRPSTESKNFASRSPATPDHRSRSLRRA